MNKTPSGIAVLSMALAGVALAQNAQNPATNPGSQKVAPPIQFSALDTNKDGRVSKDEVKAHADLTSTFSTLDTNRDTYLSEQEYGKWHSSPPPASTPPASTPPSGNMAPQTAPSGQ